MFRRFSFKSKIAATLIFMSVGLIVVSSTLILQYRNQMDQARGLFEVSIIVDHISSFIHELQKERAKSVLLLNKKIEKKELDQFRLVVDEQISILVKQIEVSAFEDLKKRSRDSIDSLKKIRELVNSEMKSPPEVAKMIGDNIEEWINIQVSFSNKYHLNGYETSLISTSILEKSKESMGRLRAAINVILAFDNPISSQAMSKLSENITGVTMNIDSPGLAISSENKKRILDILKSDDWNEVLKIYSKIVEKSGAGQYGIDVKKFYETITRVIDLQRNVMAAEIQRNNDLIKESEKLSVNKYYFSLVSISILLIFCFISSYFIVSSVNKTLISVSDSLAKGAQIVSNIALKIEESSQHLSASSTQQAAAIQETTSAIEQTTAMINKNADNAKRSTAVSDQSQISAEDGKKAVTQMLSSIDEISSSNEDILKQIEKSNTEISEINNVIRAIEDKTKIINDIVFQTKLLSFNASVEAARAGEHGKGFAVVAEEIGNLASISGRSSKEISQLLSESTQKVDEIVKSMIFSVSGLIESASQKIKNGHLTAERCKEILEEIVGNVNQVNTLVADISIASQEQAHGVEEINKAMRELDSAAQQNNSSAQESAAAVVDLNSQVQGLQQMVKELGSVVFGMGK